MSPSQGAPAVRRHGRPADEKTTADEPANTPAPSDPASIAAATKGASRPASVTLASGKLTIAADNSDLGAILQQIAHDSGMKIDGLGDNSRVFGVYGPGSPRDVLADLLSGSGYNFMMLGGANGSVPRQLLLTPAGRAPQPQANARSNAPEPDDTNDSGDADAEPLGPGAIAHPRPESPDDDQENRAQRRLQNLQQMQDQIQQREQQQNNPQ